MKGPGIGDVTMAGGSGVFGTVMAAGVVSAMNSWVVVGRRGNGRAGRNLGGNFLLVWNILFRLAVLDLLLTSILLDRSGSSGRIRFGGESSLGSGSESGSSVSDSSSLSKIVVISVGGVVVDRLLWRISLKLLILRGEGVVLDVGVGDLPAPPGRLKGGLRLGLNRETVALVVDASGVSVVETCSITVT